ncbi:hydrophobic surface binding protein [Agrocybe pediades]|nr:hydrophobic surface binding protein [Agrocybe pediades]
MKFQSSLIVLASLLSAALSATVANVIADVHNISSQITTFDNAINAFPNTGGSLVAALALHTDAVNLRAAIDKGTSDVVSIPRRFSQADGTTILNIVKGFEPNLLDALKAIVAKKPAFQALPIGGITALFKQDLINLNDSTSKFETQLIASVPSNLVASVKAIKATIDAGFANAIAGYHQA